MIKTSLSSFIYFNYSLAEAIQRTAQAGYDGIDIWGGRPHAYRHDLSRDEMASLQSLLKSLHLPVASFIPAQFRYPTCLCSNNETIRRDSVAYIQNGIETAAALGVPLVSVCPGHSLHGQGTGDAWGRLSESLNTVCEFAAGYGVRIAIEPADRFETDLINTTADAMHLIHELGHANLGLVLDTGHAHVAGESLAQAVCAAGDRLFHVHVDDNLGQRDQHLIPGEGSIDFQAFLGALEQAGYKGFVCAELSWDYTVDPEPAVHQTLSRLKRLLGQAS